MVFNHAVVEFSLGSWLLCCFLEIYPALTPGLMCYMTGVFVFVFFGVHLVSVMACHVGIILLYRRTCQDEQRN